MKSIEEITEHTLVIKKSEFICTLIPLNDEEKINEIIDFSHTFIPYTKIDSK